MEQKDLDDLREYRDKNFNVKMETCNHPLFENEINLSVTYNGFQWHSLPLNINEIEKVMGVLQKHLEENK